MIVLTHTIYAWSLTSVVRRGSGTANRRWGCDILYYTLVPAVTTCQALVLVCRRTAVEMLRVPDNETGYYDGVSEEALQQAQAEGLTLAARGREQDGLIG